jgi:hypothetical protein
VTLIKLETLRDAVGEAVIRSATLTATATSPRVAGERMILNEPIVVKLTDGLPDVALELEEPDGTWAWELSVLADGAKRSSAVTGTYRFSGEEVAWADLEPVDPSTLTPMDPVPPNVQQVLELATTKAEAAETAAQNAASAQASAAGFASSASGSAANAEAIVAEIAAQALEAEDIFWSWWSTPVAVYNELWDRTYFGGTSRSGTMRLGYFDHGTKTQKVVSVGQTSYSDDHNSLSIIVLNERGPYCFWFDHDLTTYVSYRRASVPGSLELGPEQRIQFPGPVTYFQAFYYGGVIHAFVRVNGFDWYYVKSTDFGVTWSTPVQFLSVPGRRGYMFFQQHANTQMVRLVAYGHPVESTANRIYTGFINFANGQITKPGSSTAIATLGAATPLALTDLFLAYTPPTGKKVRLFSSSTFGATPVIAFMEWTQGVDTDAMYRILRWTGSAFTAHDIVASGKEFGYDPDVHYNGGMALNAPTSDGVYLAREEAGAWYLERWKTTDFITWQTTRLATARPGEKIVRPTPVMAMTAGNTLGPINLVYARLRRYNGLQDFYANLVGIDGRRS